MTNLDISPEVLAAIESRRSVEKWHGGGLLVHQMSVNLTQPGNTMGTTEELESLTICLEYQLPEAGDGNDCFITLKTDGWSIDRLEQLQKPIDTLLECARKLVNPNAEEPEQPPRTVELDP